MVHQQKMISNRLQGLPGSWVSISAIRSFVNILLSEYDIIANHDYNLQFIGARPGWRFPTGEKKNRSGAPNK